MKAAKESTTKSERGQFFTMASPFAGQAWNRWAFSASDNIVEPFAGAGNIRQMTGLPMAMFDLEPQGQYVRERNTLEDFPSSFDTVITNPPYLAKVSATRTGTPYPDTSFADLYQYCLEICLANVDHVAAIVPASFIQAAQRGMFEGRLAAIDERTEELFQDTTVPVCVAYFTPDAKHTALYRNGIRKRELHLNLPSTSRKVVFNDPEGSVGLYATDGGQSNIRFVEGSSITDTIKVSSRTITRISGLDGLSIDALNTALSQYRDTTKDFDMCTFMGKHASGNYRRRLDWKEARRVIHMAEEH